MIRRDYKFLLGGAHARCSTHPRCAVLSKVVLFVSEVLGFFFCVFACQSTNIAYVCELKNMGDFNLHDILHIRLGLVGMCPSPSNGGCNS